MTALLITLLLTPFIVIWLAAPRMRVVSKMTINGKDFRYEYSALWLMLIPIFGWYAMVMCLNNIKNHKRPD